VHKREIRSEFATLVAPRFGKVLSRRELGEVPAQVLQDAVKRVDRAYDDFFRRVEEGQKPGYPRFKSRFRSDSLTFKQYGNSFNALAGSKKDKGTLVLAKLGHVKIVMHRAITGLPKTATVKRTPTGKWFVSSSVEIGQEEEVHERTRNRRKNFLEQATGKLIKRFGFIAVEALVVRNMLKNPKLSKSIADASWSMFFTHLLCKAEEAGRAVVHVNPAYTSQTCPSVDEQAQSIPEAHGLEPWGVVTRIGT